MAVGGGGVGRKSCSCFCFVEVLEESDTFFTVNWIF